LWRGRALADPPRRETEARRWEVRRTDARRARFEALLALGRAEAVLPDLTALCDASPLDEPFQAQRLRALRAAGRTAEALAAYDHIRRTLADQLGTDPSPELRSLHAHLLTPAPSSADAAPAPGSAPAPGPSPAHAPWPTPAPGSAPGFATPPAAGAGPASGTAPAPGPAPAHAEWPTPAPVPGSPTAPGYAPPAAGAASATGSG
ncbi:AfsR/SARP family transcriptional regulator, partial [Streptacidiphilus neutrinimicus]|uniref:AfsR/SARP family transcriptional regulator n=1 Tax=Streptacidiphilus neutrinimicus TaxID=105420 RepID=UPI00137910BE